MSMLKKQATSFLLFIISEVGQQRIIESIN